MIATLLAVLQGISAKSSKQKKQLSGTRTGDPSSGFDAPCTNERLLLASKNEIRFWPS